MANEHQNTTPVPEQEVGTPFNPDDFKLKLAQELADKPGVFQDIMRFQDEVVKNVKELKDQNAELQKQVEVKSQEANTFNQQLEQAKSFNALLMSKIPFDSFAQPKEQQQVDPMANFFKELDEAGVKKKW